MSAQALNCPTCGASITADETRCRYCDSRLATTACAACFGMMFVGSKFCPHCGAKSEPPIDAGPALPCPNCRLVMKQMFLKQVPLQECQRCYGVWVDGQTFKRICDDPKRHKDVLDEPRPARQQIVPGPVRYRPCPSCGQLMNRFNFKRSSGVIIDRCPQHGIWFDRDELRRIIDFVHSGGIESARQRERENAEQISRDRGATPRADGVGESLLVNGVGSIGEILCVISDIL
ncbi:MAG: zf-TFIIB domain-containing protein [Tepidisphaeraceae bacterium]